MNKLAKFLNLNKLEQQLLIQAYVLMTIIRLGLFFVSFQFLKSFLEKIVQFKKTTNLKITTKDIAIAIYLSSRVSFGNVRCLAQALTTNTLMNIYGYPCQLHIGVAKGEDNRLEAHAWVEAEGEVIVGYLPNLPRFKVMSSPEEKGRGFKPIY